MGQRIIDEHIISFGIEPRIQLVAVTDAKLAEHLSRQVSNCTKAGESGHTDRPHVKHKVDEDPVHPESETGFRGGPT
jgi:type I restriction enzyme R subunit